MNNTEKFSYKEVNFGSIINNLLKSNDLTDIEVRPKTKTQENDRPFTVWVVEKRRGRYNLDLNQFPKEQVDELAEVIAKAPNQLSNRMELSYNPGSAILDAESTYEDKALLRINAVHESLTDSEETPLIAIRKAYYGLGYTQDELIESNYCTMEFFDLMSILIEAGCNVVIAGKVGSGKTTLLKYLVQYIRDNESIITIEDTREAFLELIYPQKEIGSLKASDAYPFEKLIKTCLRQNMDWLLVSEIRSGTKDSSPVIDALEAVSTSSNLITTIHANGVKNIPYRMVNMAKTDASESKRIYDQVFNDINIGIFINYYNDEQGSHRQIQEVCEYYVDDDNKKQTHMIYWYDFDSKSFKHDQIKSGDIKNKIKRKNIDATKIKTNFLNVVHPEEKDG